MRNTVISINYKFYEVDHLHSNMSIHVKTLDRDQQRYGPGLTMKSRRGTAFKGRNCRLKSAETEEEPQETDGVVQNEETAAGSLGRYRQTL